MGVESYESRIRTWCEHKHLGEMMGGAAARRTCCLFFLWLGLTGSVQDMCVRVCLSQTKKYSETHVIEKLSWPPMYGTMCGAME